MRRRCIKVVPRAIAINAGQLKMTDIQDSYLKKFLSKKLLNFLRMLQVFPLELVKLEVKNTMLPEIHVT